jgi:hypothetical protein
MIGLASAHMASHCGCAAGWFCGTVPSVQRFSNVEVLKEGSWVPLVVPPEVKAVVLVNLQSYGGGRNIWGPKMTQQSVQKHGWKEPMPNDNMLEVRAEWLGPCEGCLLQGHGVTNAVGVMRCDGSVCDQSGVSVTVLAACAPAKPVMFPAHLSVAADCMALPSCMVWSCHDSSLPPLLPILLHHNPAGGGLHQWLQGRAGDGLLCCPGPWQASGAGAGRTHPHGRPCAPRC